VPFQRKKPAAIGTKASYPGFIEPALATSIEKVPSGERWVHEIKFDGYRVQVHLRDAAVKVFTRRGNDWTIRFKKIAADAWHINAGSAIIDGEVVVPSADGTTDFSILQNELKGRSTKIVMVAFDLLYLNGYDLRKLPLFERKSLLKNLINGTDIARASQSMAGKCTGIPARRAWRASFPRCAIAVTPLAGVMTG
jgi:bifunctional non-homologous end joining protein LigD